MRTRILLSMMALAIAPSALAETMPAGTCVLKVPLKATRPGGMSKWESLPSGATLSMVNRKSDWSRVRHGDTMHIVATAQFTQACVAATEPAKAAATTTKVEAEPAKAPASTTKVEAEPAKTAATTTTASSEPAKTESTTKAEAEAAKTVATMTTTVSGEPAKTESTTKAEAEVEPKKAKIEPLPSQPSSGQLFVLGLLLLGAVFTGVFLRRRSVIEQNHLDVVATRTLGRGKQLVVVDAGDSRLLLGVTDQGITLLSSTSSTSSSETSRSTRSSSFDALTERPSSRSKLSLLTEEEEAATASPATSFLKGLGSKVGSLWGRPPSGPPADWDTFDRMLASTVPDSSTDEAPPSKSRRSSERGSSGGGAADVADLARELQRHGVRRSA
jgi:flagellar biogenesis protein FliO